MGSELFFLAHALHNAVIVALTIQGVWSTLLSPIDSMNGSSSSVPAYVQIAFHVLHCVVAHRTLSKGDWAHHVLSSVAVGGLTIYYRSGPLLHYGLFFVTGLPGGINYVALVLVKRGRMARLAQKRLNHVLNMWLRMPGLVTWLAFAWTCRRDGAFDEMPLLPMLVQFVLIGGNGIYYAEMVALDLGKHMHRHSELQ